MKVLKTILFNLVILGTLIAGLEYFASMLFFKDDNFRKNTKLDALKEKAYEGLVDEFNKYQLSKYSCPKQKILTHDTDGSSVRYENPNWSCAGTTIKNNRRLTTDQPSTFKRKVHVFGGSTVYGMGSSDHFTIPSILQKEFNKKNYKTKVINHGFSTLVVSQQLQRLLKTPIEKDDIVIFYDGANDVVQREIYQKPDGTIIGYNQNNKLGFFLSDLRYFLGNHSKIYALLSKIKRNLRGEVTPKNISKCRADDFNIIAFKEKWSTYYDSISNAKNYTESYGGVFYHFLQPTLNFHLLQKSDYEYLKAIGETSYSSLCFMELLTDHYQTLDHSYKDRSHKFNGLSLSEIFLKSPLKNPGYYFIDFVHITPSGNKLIADFIFNEINKSSY